MGPLDQSLQQANDAEIQLLDDPISQDDDDATDDIGRIIYRASFSDLENSFVNCDTVQWILMSMLLILAWGVGILLLLYIPLRRYIIRRGFQSRKLYITSNAIVYKVSQPAFLPCLGVNRRENYRLLPSITDIIIEQGCLQSYFGISSIRIVSIAQGKRARSEDILIQGVVNPTLFRKVVLMTVSASRQQRPFNNDVSEDIPVEEFPPQTSYIDQHSSWAWGQGASFSSWQLACSPRNTMVPNNCEIQSQENIFQKLEEINVSLKNIQILIEGEKQQR